MQGADPVSAIAIAIGSIFGTIGAGRRARYERLPDWMQPKDFQRRDYTPEILIIGLSVAFIVTLVVVAKSFK